MTADLKELAKSIAASENPYAEFDKHASELDDTHTATLSRELNRQMFLQNLSGSDINNDVNFGTIDSGVEHGAVKTSDSADVEKTASLHVDKSHLVTDDMFLLAKTDNRMIKMASSGHDPMFEQQLIADNESVALVKTAELTQRKSDEKNRAFRLYSEIEFSFLDSLVKTASHEGEIRSYISHMIQAEKEDLIDPLILSSKYSIGDIEKTASEALDENTTANIEVILSSMKEIDGMFKTASADEWIFDEANEKIAALGSMIVKGLGSIASKGASGAINMTGKAILGGGKLAGRIGGAAIKKENLGKTLTIAGGGLLAADLVSKSENNREQIVDGLI